MNIKTALAALLLLIFTAVSVPAQEPATPKEGQISVTVRGLVNKPARYVLPATATVLDALAAAGGVAPLNDLAKVELIHVNTTGKSDRINVKEILKGVAKATALRDGDSLYIPERGGSISY